MHQQKGGVNIKRKASIKSSNNSDAFPFAMAERYMQMQRWWRGLFITDKGCREEEVEEDVASKKSKENSCWHQALRLSRTRKP